MFDRKRYKSFALTQLKNRWATPIIITLITFFVSFLFDIPQKLVMLQNGQLETLISGNYSSFLEIFEAYNNMSAESSNWWIICVQTIVEGILAYGSICVYLKMARSPEPVSVSVFFENLNNWWRAIKTALWQYLWIFIWSLLFVIPGLIKAVAYSMTFYLVCDYQDLPVTKALKISELITKGHKWDIFVTYLSFIGWTLLCVLTCGIGFIFLEPYLNMTLINVYHALMDEAFEKGLLKPEDLE